MDTGTYYGDVVVVVVVADMAMVRRWELARDEQGVDGRRVNPYLRL